MVLKNSKWDKKAKYQYMKKHGISRKPSNKIVDQPTKKWSGKSDSGIAANHENKITLEDSDEEYDSEVDDALIEHFYPQLGETELTRDQKIKIKQQIINDIQHQNEMEGEVQDNEQDEAEREEEEEEELDGIYLGSEDNKQKEMAKAPETKFDLKEFMANAEQNRSKKNRKLLSNKLSNNFLEEYGLTSYEELNRNKSDYNDIYYSKRGQRNLDEISSHDLDGFVVGQQSIAEIGDIRRQKEQRNIQYISKDEAEQDKKRSELVEQEKFYKDIKNRFDTSKPVSKSKVLEINTFNSNDSKQISLLNTSLMSGAAKEKVKISDTDLDEDINFLLGTSKPTVTSSSLRSPPESQPQLQSSLTDIDEFLADLSVHEKSNKSDTTKIKSTKSGLSNKDINFLDELLG
ncbi:uncharacterized protein RJT21DRAFT_119665 [Scheffersomyces amazonensis]|uniref:uncharacterized protein n=1 Tax=Scheffersomyces amazonensis TaxID=1078765 RepID=UPI00315D19D8